MRLHFLPTCYGISYPRWLPESLTNSAKRRTRSCKGLNGHVYKAPRSRPISGLRCWPVFFFYRDFLSSNFLKGWNKTLTCHLSNKKRYLTPCAIMNIVNLIVSNIKQWIRCWHTLSASPRGLQLPWGIRSWGFRACVLFCFFNMNFIS